MNLLKKISDSFKDIFLQLSELIILIVCFCIPYFIDVQALFKEYLIDDHGYDGKAISVKLKGAWIGIYNFDHVFSVELKP